MNKLLFNNNKTLKLSNVLINKFVLPDDEASFNITVEQMQAYIKIRGALQIGPLIQRLVPFVNASGQMEIDTFLMLQCNNYLHSVEKPYQMESVIRISDCMYCRYKGPQNKIKFAYDKINLEAFENDIELLGESYTIFIEINEEKEYIIADIFMPKVDDEK